MYFAELKGMRKEEADNSLKYWAKRLEVEEYINVIAEKLSKGNQQKIQFITAIINNPELIVLDEPFSGLDPVNTELLKSVILELVEKGKYIIMSSHQMSSIEEFCTDVLILNKGKTVLQGNLKEIKQSYKANKVEISSAVNIDSILSSLNLRLISNKDNDYTIQIQEETEAINLLEKLVQEKIKINKFEIKKPTLNDIFIEKVGK